MSEDRPAPSLVDTLNLQPHPEGGWFRETWRSDVALRPPGYEGERASATCIYFLLGPGQESRWHTVKSAELWFWHSGGPLLLKLGGAGDVPAAEPETITLGGRAATGESPHAVVPPGIWQSARPAIHQEVLVSCVVSPGFDFADFRLIS